MATGSHDFGAVAEIAPSSRVIDGIYDAALDPSLWPDVIAEVSRTFANRPAFVLVNDTRTGSTPLFVAAGIQQWSLDRFKQDFSTADRNPLLLVAMTAPTGKALHLPELVGEDRYDSCALYNDINKPLGMRHYLDSVALRTGSLFVGFNVAGSLRKQRPAEREALLFESTTRHIGRAFRLADSLGGASARVRNLEATLDCLAAAVFLVDRAGVVSWRNRAAAELLDRRDGLALRSGRLAADGHADDRAVQLAFLRATDATLRIARPSGGRAFILNLHRLWNSLASSGASFVVFVSDPDADHLTDARIAGAFDLTDAEARTALAVSRSRGIADAASALGLSPNTVKTTLQRVFAKTGTHSQAELVRLVVSSLGYSHNGRSDQG